VHCLYLAVSICVDSRGSWKRCSVSGCPYSADVEFDNSTLPGYNVLHAAQKTQLYCKPPLLKYVI